MCGSNDFKFCSDAAAGSSGDWATSQGIPWSFALELSPAADDENSYGFVLPARFIIPAASEAWAGIMTVADMIKRTN